VSRITSDPHFKWSQTQSQSKNKTEHDFKDLARSKVRLTMYLFIVLELATLRHNRTRKLTIMELTSDVGLECYNGQDHKRSKLELTAKYPFRSVLMLMTASNCEDYVSVQTVTTVEHGVERCCISAPSPADSVTKGGDVLVQEAWSGRSGSSSFTCPSSQRPR
jgi:hypothetical protein